MQAVGKKNRTNLHSLYDFVLMTRGILCIGTGGHVRKRRRGSLSFGISIYVPHTNYLLSDLFIESKGNVIRIPSPLP